MANSRIMLTCKHCGEQLAIGKGYLGSYVNQDEKIHEHLNEFYAKHCMGVCSDAAPDCSDDAKEHFVILEKCDTLNAFTEWISVNERLPTVEENENGIVGIVNGHNGKIGFTDGIIFVDYDFNEKEWWSQDYDLTGCKVDYWMPLPKAPKGGAE